MVDVPTLVAPKVQLDGALSTNEAVGVPVHHRELDQMAFKGPFQLKQFYEKGSWQNVSSTVYHHVA